jgi:hypothetical protein
MDSHALNASIKIENELLSLLSKENKTDEDKKNILTKY